MATTTQQGITKNLGANAAFNDKVRTYDTFQVYD